MGLRVPYFGLPLSRELGLPDGQLSYPTTEELLRNTFRVRMYRYILQTILDLDIYRRPGTVRRMLMQCGVLGPGGRSSARAHADYPADAEMGGGLSKGFARHGADALLFMMAREVALDLPGVDPRNIDLSGERVVVWFADDDGDCPPSHGAWLASHFSANTRVFDGYGHVGGACIDHPQFVEALMGRP